MSDTVYRGPVPGQELTPAHVARLERLRDAGFEFTLFPLYPGFLGVVKDGWVALLRPAPEGTLEPGTQPSMLLEGNISVRTEQGGRECFVWKRLAVPVTEEHRESLAAFRKELANLLAE